MSHPDEQQELNTNGSQPLLPVAEVRLPEPSDDPISPSRRNVVLENGYSTHGEKSALPGLYLDVNRFSQEWEADRGRYVPRKGEPQIPETETEAYSKYAFAIVRYYNHTTSASMQTFRTEIQSWSPHFIKAAEIVMKDVKELSWKSRPLSATSEQFLSFLDDFQTYLDELESKPLREHTDALIIEHVDFFIRFMRMEYQEMLRSLAENVKHSQITFDLIWGIFKPGMTLFAKCAVTNEPRAVYLEQIFMRDDGAPDKQWELLCHCIEIEDNRLGQVPLRFNISHFHGVKSINQLLIFPIQYHHQSPKLEESLIARGRKWFGLRGVHHMKFDAVAFRADEQDYTKFKKIHIKSRIIIDKDSLAIYDGRIVPVPIYRSLDGGSLTVNLVNDPDASKALDSVQLTDNQLLITSAYVYGFSLGSKLWLMFPVEHVQPIDWSPDSFKHLSLPPQQKELIESLVDTHSHMNQPVDDFVEGKGRGLIFSLSGPPGVGKTLTAEATSELTKRPLYVVSANEIGTTALDLDATLTRVFSISHLWNAIVLIDEADVFLQQRSLKDLERNAIVAVLLRKLEYFPGILFLTTNRVHIFDEALQSRIHVSLHYTELSEESKKSIWTSFLLRAGVELAPVPSESIGSSLTSGDTSPALPWSPQTIKKLSNQPLNGRQIKNAVNTACVLAKHRHQKLLEEHLWQVIETNDPMPLESNDENITSDDGKKEGKGNSSSVLKGSQAPVLVVTLAVGIVVGHLLTRLNRLYSS